MPYLTIDPPLISSGNPSLPTIEIRRSKNNRKLSALYKAVDRSYEVECTYSACRTKCCFHQSELGFVVFERDSGLFIDSNKHISQSYLAFLQRTLCNWNKLFNDFDLL